ncbi:MAG: hypothetical protein E7598_04130 [Ruminococcaceae bacterium]|nr:hypothetical protein [Oscillospiraceae bacterium]
MFDFLLDAATSIRQVPHETISEKLAVGGEVTLRGMGTVFAVLILIWILVEFLHLLLGVKTPKVEKVTEATTVPAEKTSEEIATPIPQTAPASDDLALIAVITAAVAAASGSSPNSFRVVSFKRANNKFSSGK